MQEFGKSRTWRGIDQLRRREKHPSFLSFVTYFDSPAVLVLQDLVEAVDAGRISPEDAASSGSKSKSDREALRRSQDAVGGGARQGEDRASGS